MMNSSRLFKVHSIKLKKALLTSKMGTLGIKIVAAAALHADVISDFIVTTR